MATAATLKEHDRNLKTIEAGMAAKMAPPESQAVVGYGESVQPPTLRRRRRHEPRSRGLRLGGGAGALPLWKSRIASGGENYVLWGGREGYDSLLNTDLRPRARSVRRFLSMVVEHKHRIGFKGTILIEPKPFEPTKHQYDHDVAAVFAFLQRYGLDEGGQGQHRGQSRDAGGPGFRA
jgi:xylose isomerase